MLKLNTQKSLLCSHLSLEVGKHHRLPFCDISQYKPSYIPVSVGFRIHLIFLVIKLFFWPEKSLVGRGMHREMTKLSPHTGVTNTTDNMLNLGNPEYKKL